MKCDKMKYTIKYYGLRGAILIECKYHRVNKVGIRFCSLREKGKKKLKGESLVGICYSTTVENRIPMFKVFKKDMMRWAVQHLQYDESKTVAKLAKDIVNGRIETN